MKSPATILSALLLVGFLVLGGFSFRLYGDIEDLKLKSAKGPSSNPLIIDNREPETLESGQSGEVVPQTATADISDAQMKELKQYIDKAVATLSGSTKTITVTSTPQPKSQTTYISMGTTYSTTNTDWVDVSDSGVYIDLNNDYGSSAKVTWEASLKVANSNGQAFARLWDDTNKIAVAGSEISTTNNSEFKQVSSPNLPLWKGRNLYKIQVKSLNSFVVTYSGGKIRITY